LTGEAAEGISRLRGGHAARRAVVDVGIPTHGEPSYLHEAVESVLEQSFEDWRLTVSENGPGTAEIEAILKPYLSDPRVRYVKTGDEVSGAENATKALQAGRALYVAILHDDDRWDSDFLAPRVSFLEANPTCGIVFSNYRFIDDRGVPLSTFTAPLREGLQPREKFLRALYLRNFIGTPAVLGRRSAYDRVNANFHSVLFYDYEMWLRIASRFDVGFLDIYDADYRIHPGQSTHREFQHMGEHRLELLESVDPWLPPVFPRRDRRRARAGAYLRVSFDALRRGESRSAAVALARALREYPAAPVDWRIAMLVVNSLRARARQRQVWQKSDAPRSAPEHTETVPNDSRDEGPDLSPDAAARAPVG